LIGSVSYGRREAAIDRGDRRLGNAGEDEALARRRQFQHGTLERTCVEDERQIVAVLADEPERERNDHRLLVGLSRCRRDSLFDIEPVGFGARVIMRRDHDFGRSGLRVPEHELREIATRYVGEALHELLDRRGFAVMPIEIEVHALAKQFGAEQRLDHAHDLTALVIDGGRVEVVDLVIELGPHRVGERSGILDELMRA
jgi:hypothetical protein